MLMLDPCSTSHGTAAAACSRLESPPCSSSSDPGPSCRRRTRCTAVKSVPLAALLTRHVSDLWPLRSTAMDTVQSREQPSLTPPDPPPCSVLPHAHKFPTHPASVLRHAGRSQVDVLLRRRSTAEDVVACCSRFGTCPRQGQVLR
jgi:hypothetical protein